MIALIFFSFAIFAYGLIYQYKAETQKQLDTGFLVIMFGMISMITLACIVTVGGYR